MVMLLNGLRLVVIGLVLALVLINAPARGEDFLEALNAERVAANLRPVAYDASLEDEGKRNNQVMSSTQISGHYVCSPGHGQCAYYGPRSALAALRGWAGGIGYLASPSHWRVLMHPGAQRIAVAQGDYTNTVVVAFTPAAQAPPAPKKQVESKPALPSGAPFKTNGEDIAGLARYSCCPSCKCSAVPRPCNSSGRIASPQTGGGGRRGFRPLLWLLSHVRIQVSFS